MKAELREIAAWCGATYDKDAGSLTLEGVSTDSRQIRPGQLFVPLAGERFDGHDYLQAAREAGAAASLWNRGRPIPAGGAGLPLVLVEDTLAALQQMARGYLARLNAKVVAVTGSNGKTTTKDMMSSLLATRFRVHKTEGNFNNHIGLPLTILRAPEDAEVLVLEMGMSGRGEISLLSNLASPDVAVITNIGEAHLLQLGSRRNIARAKLEIAEGLKAGGALIINGDEPLLKEELAQLALPAGASVITFGESENCSYRLLKAEGSAEKTAFSALFEGNPVQVEIPVPGRHNALNALAAAAAGSHLGLAQEEIREGFKQVKLTGMRIERTRAACGAVVLNDAYNASPTSVKAAIRLLRDLGGYRRKVLVLGDMLELGPDEAEFHASIGRQLSPEIADRLYLYGPLSAHTLQAAQPQYPEGAVRHFSDKRQLAEALLADVGPDDLVLVKASRGMRLEEIVFALEKGGAC
jgi:UDP-N-acetylmuramoyl-tripeptide--D-alanyl-D-alanine ligase